MAVTPIVHAPAVPTAPLAPVIREMALADLVEAYPHYLRAVVRGALMRMLADADEFDREWSEYHRLQVEEDILTAHNDPPYSLDVHFKLDGIRSALGYSERRMETLERRLRGGS